MHTPELPGCSASADKVAEQTFHEWFGGGLGWELVKTGGNSGIRKFGSWQQLCTQEPISFLQPVLTTFFSLDVCLQNNCSKSKDTYLRPDCLPGSK